jgi:uncharacterized membrane protein
MKTLRREWIQLLILAVPFFAAALLWDRLPDQMPIHWNIHGQVDGYAGRAFGAFFLPCMNAVTIVFISIVALIDPRVRKQDAETRAGSLRVFRGVRLALSLFLTALSLTTLGIAIGMPLDVSRIICAGMALLFLVLGNLMGKIRPNYFLGVRTPWTLESREVWQKTHRLAGKLMVGGSAVMLAGALLLPSKASVLFILPVALLIAAIPIVYSYVIYKKQAA